MTGRTPLACLVTLTAFASVLIFSAGDASAGTCIDTQGCGSAISVSVDGPYYGNQGSQATYTYTVSNNGSNDLSDITVNDTQDDESPACQPITGPTGDDGDGILSPDEVWTYSCTTTLDGPVGSYVHHNVQATGDDGDGTVSDNTQIYTGITALHIKKTVDKSTADPFDDLNYTITISNDGPQDSSFYYEGYLSDQNCDQIQTDSENADGTWFDVYPGESVTYTCTHNFNPGSGEGQDPNPYVNTACADASVYSQEVLASQQVQVASKGYNDLHQCDSASTALAQHTVTGQVFEDMNADGVRQDGEPVFPGIVVYADLNGNGVRDADEPSSTSDSQGNYSLDVPLGTTTIREDIPSNITCSFPAGCAYTVDLPKNPPPAPPVDVLTRAVDPTNQDFGDWRPATVTGTVVGDQNNNGARDAGENGLGNILVYADLNGTGDLDPGEPSTRTAADGTYVLGGLKPGGYVIRHILVQDGRTCSGPAGGCAYNITLASNASAPNKDFFDAPKPGQLVLPARIVPGVARLTGRTGCITASGFYARVRGRQMQRVIFLVDGTAVKSVTLPKDNHAYRYRVNVTRLKFGRHQLAVKVVFRTKSHTASKTLRMSFARCAPQLRAPAFTG